jgi:prevent-host-death family protein
MIRKSTPKTPIRPRRRAARKTQPGRWMLQDAKARFSELVRCARSEGPQHVTVHGREGVVVLAAADYHRLKGDRSGQLLVDLLRNSPLRDVAIEPKGVPSPVRDVKL